MTETDALWGQTLKMLESDLNETTFKTYFSPSTIPVGVFGDTFVIEVSSPFARAWMEDRFTGAVADRLAHVAGRRYEIKFKLPDDDIPPVEESASRTHPEAVDTLTTEPSSPSEIVEVGLEAREDQRVEDARLGKFNDRWTFENFVVGESNRFGYHAAMRVAETPGKWQNPLFIYGGSGLGKTHLMQAIGHYCYRSYPGMRVRYATAENFMNDLISAINGGDQNQFRRVYRDDCDILLIDDVQFLAQGRAQATQEELFHTINDLILGGKQVVLCADRPPSEMSVLDDRMRQRFGQGVAVDIQPPDLETRVAILKKKAEMDGLDVPEGVLNLIADRVWSNVRELEGLLIRVTSFALLTEKELTTEMAQEWLRNDYPERATRPVSVATIQSEVCKFFGVTKNELVGPKRSQAIVFPRQIAMYLSRELTDLSLPRIGQEFGGRDHTTVMHATSKIERLMSDNREVYNQIQTLTDAVRKHT